VIDEILSVGDAAFQQKCMRFLNRFRLHGTLLFVSHDSGAVVKLCDRALWLDRGQMRALGASKEICRLYLAAQAEEVANDEGRFQIGGRSRCVSAVPVPGPAAQERKATPDFAQLLFDADDLPPAAGGAEIEAAGFHTPGGEKLRVAMGGEVVEVRILMRAARNIDDIVLAFALRDRLGQIILSDDTLSLDAQRLASGEFATAKFRFLLPYLANGAYALESFVFERKAGMPALLQHRAEKEFLYIQSPHPSNGLANIAMRGVSLRPVGPPADENLPLTEARLEAASP